MNILIIDQIVEVLIKYIPILAKILRRKNKQDQDNNNLQDQLTKNKPEVPIILKNRPGTIVNDNKLTGEYPSNVNQNVVMWTKATPSAAKPVEAKIGVHKRLMGRFMRRMRKGQGRGA